MTKEFNVIHKKMIDEEIYQLLKKQKLSIFMKADKWKKLRLIELKKEGKNWSK